MYDAFAHSRRVKSRLRSKATLNVPMLKFFWVFAAMLGEVGGKVMMIGNDTPWFEYWLALIFHAEITAVENSLFKVELQDKL